MKTYTYFAQAIVDIQTRQVREYELLLRAWDPQGREWYLPDSFDISVGMQTRMIKEALKDLDVKRVSINLTAAQFASRPVLHRLSRLMNSTPELEELTVELTAAPTVADLQSIGAEYHQNNIHVALDDVGSDIDDFDLAQQLAPNVDSFKFALQNLRDQGRTDNLLGAMQPWSKLAADNGIQFTVEGIESYSDLQMARKAGAERAQGFFFNHPGAPKERKQRDFASQITNLDDLMKR